MRFALGEENLFASASSTKICLRVRNRSAKHPRTDGSEGGG